MKHFMIDLETLSTRTDAVVVSIGAVEFDPLSGVVHNEFYAELRFSDQHNRQVDVDTFTWWVKQIVKNGTDASVFLKEEKVPVRNALLLLRDFLGDGSKEIWACDPDFDCAILADLYKEYSLSTPWRYHEPKSVRTIRLLAKMHGVELPAREVLHNALEDCKRQAAEVVAFNKAVKNVQ